MSNDVTIAIARHRANMIRSLADRIIEVLDQPLEADYCETCGVLQVHRFGAAYCGDCGQPYDREAKS